VIHHIGVFAADLSASRAFYRAALAPLGIIEQYSTDRVCELWAPGTDAPSLSVEQAVDEPTSRLHLAFEAPDRAAVDAFLAAATAAGGTTVMYRGTGRSTERTARSSATRTGTTSRRCAKSGEHRSENVREKWLVRGREAPPRGNEFYFLTAGTA
jgi:catechol 2,3-dioxygenase-like lactoylglutathione lyase family enzyme